jgi:hypothetical protein
MTLFLVVTAMFVASLAAGSAACWLAQRVWTAGAKQAPARRSPRSTSRSAPWTRASLRAIAVASCSAMGVYPPACGWEDDEEEILLLQDSQLLLATADGDSLVLDCLVPAAATTAASTAPCERRPHVPFTLDARLPRRPRGARVPSPLRRWLETGAAIDISVRRRRGGAVAQLTGSGSFVSLALRSPAQPPDPRPEGL